MKTKKEKENVPKTESKNEEELIVNEIKDKRKEVWGKKKKNDTYEKLGFRPASPPIVTRSL